MSQGCPGTCGRMAAAAVYISVGVVQVIAGIILLRSQYVDVLSGPNFWTAASNIAVGCLLGISTGVWKHTNKKADKYAMRRKMLAALVVSSVVVNGTTTTLLLLSEGDSLMSISLEGDTPTPTITLGSEVLAYAFATSVCSPVVCIVVAIIFLSGTCFKKKQDKTETDTQHNILADAVNIYNWVFVPDKRKEEKFKASSIATRSWSSSSSSSDSSGTPIRSNSVPSKDYLRYPGKRESQRPRSSSDISLQNFRNPQDGTPRLISAMKLQDSKFETSADLSRKPSSSEYTPHRSQRSPRDYLAYSLPRFDSVNTSNDPCGHFSQREKYLPLPNQKQSLHLTTNKSLRDIPSELTINKMQHDTSKNVHFEKPYSMVSSNREFKFRYKDPIRDGIVGAYKLTNASPKISFAYSEENDLEANKCKLGRRFSTDVLLEEMRGKLTGVHRRLSVGQLSNVPPDDIFQEQTNKRSAKNVSFEEPEQYSKSARQSIPKNAEFSPTGNKGNKSFGNDFELPRYMRRTSTTTAMNSRNANLNNSVGSTYSVPDSLALTEGCKSSSKSNSKNESSLYDYTINSSFGASETDISVGEVVSIRLNNSSAKNLCSKLIPVESPVVPEDFVEKKFKSRKKIVESVDESQKATNRTFTSFRADLQPKKILKSSHITANQGKSLHVSADDKSTNDSVVLERSLSSPAQTSGYGSSVDVSYDRLSTHSAPESSIVVLKGNGCTVEMEYTGTQFSTHKHFTQSPVEENRECNEKTMFIT